MVVRGQTGLLGFAGYKSSFRFSERPCLEEIWWSDKKHRLSPLALMHPSMYPSPHKEKNELLSSNPLPFASIHPGEGPQLYSVIYFPIYSTDSYKVPKMYWILLLTEMPNIQKPYLSLCVHVCICVKMHMHTQAGSRLGQCWSDVFLNLYLTFENDPHWIGSSSSDRWACQEVSGILMSAS